MRRIWVALLLLVTAGCAAPYRQIRDLRTLPQRASAYLDPASADRPLLPAADRQALSAELLAHHFAPWHPQSPPLPIDKAFAIATDLATTPVYGENLRRRDPSWLISLIRRADPCHYPSLDERGISVRRIDVRALPTRRPAFRDPSLPGQGYPFDLLQVSALPAQTPLRIVHRSADDAWLFVESGAVAGWVPAADVARVDDRLAADFESGRYLALTEDGVPLVDAQGVPRGVSRLGMLLPLATAPDGDTSALVVAANADGRGVLRRLPLPIRGAAPYPLPLTPRRLADVADGLIGQSYGWGGLSDDRDCSSTLRDLFCPFGLWLPRHSSAQAAAYRFESFAEVPPTRRAAMVRARGIPFRTLLWMPGHVMLYLGIRDGRAVIFHDFWGIRTYDPLGREGRHVVGETAITTLTPGRELSDVFANAAFGPRLAGMTFLGEPPAAPATP